MNQTHTTRTGASGKPAASHRDGQSLRKRSVTVAGHRTSVSLEQAFWAALCRIAAAKGRSVSQLVTEIDRTRGGNLSSAIRVFVLTEIVAASEPGPPAS